jgi:hypothetical protein
VSFLFSIANLSSTESFCFETPQPCLSSIKVAWTILIHLVVYPFFSVPGQSIFVLISQHTALSSTARAT